MLWMLSFSFSNTAYQRPAHGARSTVFLHSAKLHFFDSYSPANTEEIKQQLVELLANH